MSYDSTRTVALVFIVTLSCIVLWVCPRFFELTLVAVSFFPLLWPDTFVTDSRGARVPFAVFGAGPRSPASPDWPASILFIQACHVSEAALCVCMCAVRSS